MTDTNENLQASDLAEIVKHTRATKGWTQSDLARQSGVSVRTISFVEGGHVPRRQVIGQLAKACDIDPNQWLKMAGLPIAETSAMPINRVSGELHPEEYFDSILARFPQSKSALLIPCYASVPRLLERVSIFEKWIQLINKGMWIALVFPYPTEREKFDQESDLALFYENVFNQLKILFKTVRRGVASDARGRIGIFVPSFMWGSHSAPLVMPSLGMAETRPTYLKFVDHANKEDAELVLLFRVAGQDSDRCAPIFADNGVAAQGAQNIQTFNYWSDYLREIVDQWRSIRAKPIAKNESQEAGWQDVRDEFKDWRLYEDA